LLLAAGGGRRPPTSQQRIKDPDCSPKEYMKAFPIVVLGEV
jgi:hypothetical protein